MTPPDTSTTPVRMGLVGVGWMGHLHTRALRRLRDHYPDLPAPRFVIAADSQPAQEAEARSRLGYEQFSTDWRDVVADPDVTTVSVTAPNQMHAEVCVAAARAGKHIWGEKPLGRDAQETATIAAVAREHDVRTVVGFNYRHVPLVEHARSLIETGELGRLTRVRGTFLADYAADAAGAFSWRFERAKAGSGVLGDLMCHVVDLVEHLAGPVRSLVAQDSITHTHRPLPTAAASSGASHFAAGGGDLVPVENEDHVSCLARFDNGAAGSLEVGRAVVGPHVSMGFEIHGTAGALAWNFERMNELRLYTRSPAAGDGFATVFAAAPHGEFSRFQPGTGIPMGYDDLKVIEASRLVGSIVDGRSYGPTFDDAERATSVVAGMEASLRSGAWEQVL